MQYHIYAMYDILIHHLFQYKFISHTIKKRRMEALYNYIITTYCNNITSCSG